MHVGGEQTRTKNTLRQHVNDNFGLLKEVDLAFVKGRGGADVKST